MASKIDETTRAIVLINPNNPTGSVVLVPRRCDADAAIWRIEHNLVHLQRRDLRQAASSTVATHTTRPRRSAAEAKVITFNGMSKAYVVPGFRIGWGVVSGPPAELEDYCEAIRKLERSRLSANHPEQHAIRPALEADQSHIAAMMERLTRRRNITTDRLNSIEGISCVEPGGAFYAFPRIDLGVPDTEFCARVIRETGVVIVPGSGFGQREGTQHFRVVFLPQEDVLEKAYDRIAEIAATCR